MKSTRSKKSCKAPAALERCVTFSYSCLASFFVLVSIVFPHDAWAQDDLYTPQDPHFRIGTQIGIAICDNGIVDPGELCDSGMGNNDAMYSSTTAGRHCAPGCRSWGPYCGDGVLKAYYGEECSPTGADDKFCSMQCKQTSVPVSTTTPPNPPPRPSGSGGGSAGNVNILADTKVVVSGKGYPNAQVQVLKDGQLQGIVNSGSDASFRYEMINATPGPTTLAFWSSDAKGTRSITQATSFQVTQNAVSYVNNVFLPPTIRARALKVAPGALAHFEGTTVPTAVANIVADRERIPRASASTTSSGEWSMDVPTEGLTAESRHQFLPFFTIGAGAATQQSSNGMAVALFLGAGAGTASAGGSGDINGDGKVSLVDFSMLLSHWGDQYPPGDFNGNGKADIADLSIMLSHWTG